MSDIKLIIDYENGNIKQVTDETEKELGKSGKKASKDFSINFSKGIKSAAKGVGILSAAVAGVGTIAVFKSIGLAREQEDAVNRLNGALRASGDFSTDASIELQNYASELQKVSTIGDEVALGQLALAKGFGATNEQAKEIVSAAADLSVALGIDLESATRNVSKTLGGYAGELGEVIPELKNFSQEQLQAGAAIDVIAEKFRGLAANETQTFSGAIAQAGNSFGDFLEKIGGLVTQNPAVIKGLNALSKTFDALGKEVEDFAMTFDIFNDLLIPLTGLNKAIIENVVAPLELVANIGQIVFDSLVSGVSTVVAGFGFLGGKIAEFLSKFGIAENLTQGLQDFAVTSQQVAEENALKVGESLRKTFDFPVADTLATKNEDLRVFFQQQRDIIAEEGEMTTAMTTQQVEAVAEQSQSFASLLVDTFSNVGIQLTQTQKQMQQVAKQTANIVQNGLARGISGGIQNIVASLAAGENVFANFGKFLLSTFGDLAIQLGQFFIAQGIAVEALNAVSGTGAIAAGAGLVALGALLKSFAGGGGASSSSAPGGSAANPSFTSDVSPTGEFVEEGRANSTPQTNVTFNVEGNVQGNEEFIRDTVAQIGDEAGKQGLVFDNFQTA